MIDECYMMTLLMCMFSLFYVLLSMSMLLFHVSGIPLVRTALLFMFAYT